MSFIREQIVKRITRSNGWRKVRNQHITEHPTCAACGTDKDPEVHHIQDFSTHADMELNPGNLITLCGKRCHFIFGHLLNWKSINPAIKKDADWFRLKVVKRR